MNRITQYCTILSLIFYISCKSEPTEKYIKMAKEINDHMPHQFNRGLRLDSVKAVSSHEFKYYYTLLNDPNTSSGNFIQASKPQIIEGLKNSKDADNFRVDHMTIIYSYSKADGSKFTEFEVAPSEY